jgi:hypothetical protein
LHYEIFFGRRTIRQQSEKLKISGPCHQKIPKFSVKQQPHGNNNTDNAFLEALAEGGFQVGELAKLYHPVGVEITTTDKEEASAQTAELLKQDKAIIYEAAFITRSRT